jgi:hypothetical protein
MTWTKLKKFICIRTKKGEDQRVEYRGVKGGGVKSGRGSLRHIKCGRGIKGRDDPIPPVFR